MDEEKIRETNCYMTNEMDGFLKSNIKLYDEEGVVQKIVQDNGYPPSMFPDLSDDEILAVHEESVLKVFEMINAEKPATLDLQFEIKSDGYLNSSFTLTDLESVEDSILSSFFSLDREKDQLSLDEAVKQIEDHKQLICETES